MRKAQISRIDKAHREFAEARKQHDRVRMERAAAVYGKARRNATPEERAAYDKTRDHRGLPKD